VLFHLLQQKTSACHKKRTWGSCKQSDAVWLSSDASVLANGCKSTEGDQSRRVLELSSKCTLSIVSAEASTVVETEQCSNTRVANVNCARCTADGLASNTTLQFQNRVISHVPTPSSEIHDTVDFNRNDNNNSERTDTDATVSASPSDGCHKNSSVSAGTVLESQIPQNSQLPLTGTLESPAHSYQLNNQSSPAISAMKCVTVESASTPISMRDNAEAVCATSSGNPKSMYSAAYSETDALLDLREAKRSAGSGEIWQLV
jgi:hypothetical protein